MFPRRLVSFGVGGTVFLVAGVLGFEVFGSDFPSVFYVLPIALLAGIGGAIGAYYMLGSRPGRGVRSALTGIAAISYVLFFLWFVRYSIASTRAVLSFDRIAVLSVALGAAVAAFVWIARAGSEAEKARLK
jgi:hypothetical protein